MTNYKISPKYFLYSIEICQFNIKSNYKLQRSKDIKQQIRTYLQLDGAIFSALTADRERKGELVPVLLRIIAEPENAYERFNALASHALQWTLLSARRVITHLCDPWETWERVCSSNSFLNFIHALHLLYALLAPELLAVLWVILETVSLFTYLV